MKNAGYRKIILTLGNIVKSYIVMQLHVDNTLKTMFSSQKQKQITEYNHGRNERGGRVSQTFFFMGEIVPPTLG